MTDIILVREQYGNTCLHCRNGGNELLVPLIDDGLLPGMRRSRAGLRIDDGIVGRRYVYSGSRNRPSQKSRQRYNSPRLQAIDYPPSLRTRNLLSRPLRSSSFRKASERLSSINTHGACRPKPKR